MKFAHIADCHIGGWREERLKELGIRTFNEAIDVCIKENVGFVLIAGDLFDTSLPSIDLIREVASILNKLREHNISVYIIPGSHDFSPSGKTMLDVLEKAGLVDNVCKFEENDKIKLNFTIDKTNTKITGLFGRKGGLETTYYEKLDKNNLESEDGFKIFMFHTGINEFKPEDLKMLEMESVASLPKNFNYYAGGHIHYIFDTDYGNGKLVFPGALFPNNFAELEKYSHGGFYIVSDTLELRYVPIKFYDTINLNINVDGKSASEAEFEIINKLPDVTNKIVLMRIHGVLSSGKVSDINFKEILERMSDAYVVLKNTNKLSTKEHEEMKVENGSSEEIENKIIHNNLSGIFENEEKLIHDLINSASLEKNEGETNLDFEKRVVTSLSKIFNLENVN